MASYRPATALCLIVLLGVTAAVGGCARTARDTSGFAISDSATVGAPFQDAWQTTKSVLREKKLDLYTRDKRGVFVAFSDMKRYLAIAPHRVKYTITLEPVSDAGTKITVETIKQVYGVTLLTYPGWHDRKATDHAEAKAILEAVQAKVGNPAAPAKG